MTVPRMMKALGPLVGCHAGVIHANYEIDAYGADLDPDTEAELRSVCRDRALAVIDGDGKLHELQTLAWGGRHYRLVFYVAPTGCSPVSGMTIQ